MKKLASTIDALLADAEALSVKTAADSTLPVENALPTISTDLGNSLVKIAGILRDSDTEIDYNDLNDFVERIRNA